MVAHVRGTRCCESNESRGVNGLKLPMVDDVLKTIPAAEHTNLLVNMAYSCLPLCPIAQNNYYTHYGQNGDLQLLFPRNSIMEILLGLYFEFAAGHHM